MDMLRGARRGVALGLWALIAGTATAVPPAGDVGAGVDDVGAAPTVNAGADQVITLADRAFLIGQVSDDGLPAPSELAFGWRVVSGPGRVTIAHRDEGHTSA